MPKRDPILVNSMDSSSSMAVGLWDGTTPGILEALDPHRHDHYTCMFVEAGHLPAASGSSDHQHIRGIGLLHVVRRPSYNPLSQGHS